MIKIVHNWYINYVNIIKDILDVIVIENDVHHDDRGFFYESFVKEI